MAPVRQHGVPQVRPQSIQAGLVGIVIGVTLALVSGLIAGHGSLFAQSSRGAPGNGHVFSNAALQVHYPDGWALGTHTAPYVNLSMTGSMALAGDLLLEASNHGGTGVQPLSGQITTILQADRRRPHAVHVRLCRPPVAMTLAGKTGTDFIICYVAPAQDGEPIAYEDEYFVSVTSGNTAFYTIGWWSPVADHDAFLRAAWPLVASIRWKIPS
jgi:hypothetical protein